jgi:thiol-disulfide isomerase/thioredoxin
MIHQKGSRMIRKLYGCKWMVAAGLLAAAGLMAGAGGAAATRPADGGTGTQEPVKVGSSRTDQSKAQAQALRDALVGKPLVVSGKTLDGKDFATSELRGKVVLVDFWASWCPDCKAEMPSVIKAYQKYHPQGLEIVGVSSDVAADDLKAYLKEHGEISWLQLYTPPLANGRHPLNTQYGVDWIPTIFVIDRAGVCRSVSGSKELEGLIPKLLAEKTN